jgi:enterobacterial common antigen flippase
MREFAKTGSLFAGVRIITLAVAVIQVKFIALTLGPTATGLYSVINNFLLILTLLATLNLSVAASKYLSEYYSEGKLDHLRYAYSFCVKFVSITSVASFLLVVILSRQLTKFLFGGVEYREYVILTAATILFSVSAVYIGSLNGLFERRAIAKVQVLAAVLGLICVAVLIPLFSLRGYFVSLLLIAFFNFALGYLSIRSTSVLGGTSVDLTRVERGEIRRKLFTFSGSNLLLIIVQPLSFFIIRYSILRALGADGVGFYAACLSVSTLVFGLLQVNLYYYFPKMNTVMPAPERVRLINEFFRFSLLTLPPIMMAMILLPDLIVLVLYSRKFLPIVAYLPLFVLAEFASNIAGVFATPVVGLTKLRFHVIWTFIYYLLWSASSVFLFKKMGLRGVALATIFACGLWGGGYYIYLKGLIPLHIEGRNLRMFALVVLTAALCVMAAAFLPNLAVRICIYLVVLTSAFYLFDASERRKITAFAQQIIGRLRFSN